jgi:GNAT superfamily N-acetyltransferase
MGARVKFRLRRVDATDPAVWAHIVALDAWCFTKESAPALSDNAGAWWIAFVGKHEAGYCGVKRTPSGNGYLCRAGVLARYRGGGLQKLMIRRRVAYARSQGWPMVVTDTHDNAPSGNSLIACGFKLYDPDKKWAFDTSLYWRRLLSPRT